MLSSRFIKVFPALASLMMAGAMFIQMKAWAVADSPTEFNVEVQRLAEAIPFRFGRWEGTAIEVPSPAAKLLRPNVLFARRYENVQTSRIATLVLVHCTDSRDMSGHYPPNCYPASGWTPVGDPEMVLLTVGGKKIRAAAYEYTRTELGSSRHTVVYNFFILPTGLATRMSDVQAASGDTRSRPYGAAQVQIIMDASTPAPTQIQIAQELLEPLSSIIELLQVRKEGKRS